MNDEFSLQDLGTDTEVFAKQSTSRFKACGSPLLHPLNLSVSQSSSDLGRASGKLSIGFVDPVSSIILMSIVLS